MNNIYEIDLDIYNISYFIYFLLFIYVFFINNLRMGTDNLEKKFKILIIKSN